MLDNGGYGPQELWLAVKWNTERWNTERSIICHILFLSFLPSPQEFLMGQSAALIRGAFALARRACYAADDW
jgi:hypothetical protein